MIHTIRAQYVHINLSGTEADGLALQARLSGFCNDWLWPAMERVLDRYAPTNGHLYLERLEIDAGTLSMERLENDLAHTVAQALEKAIQEQLPSDAKPTTRLADPVQPKTEVQASGEAFVYFLKTGRLPWFFRLAEGKTLEQTLLDSWEKSADGSLPFGKEDWLQTLGEANVRKRLIRQFSASFRDKLLAHFALEVKGIIEGIRHTLHTAGAETTAVERFTLLLWEAALARMTKGQTSTITEEKLVGDAWRDLTETHGFAGLKNALERQWPGTNWEAKAAPEAIWSAREASASPKGSAATLSDEVASKEGLYIDNAGLVLLNPFLPRFFEALGIASEDTLLQPDRALCLLNYLATGQSEAPEYELVLPKILCNIPLETPVELHTTLLDSEKEEAAALLEAVIRHWEALRSTSPDSLRGTFLLRPGKLSIRADGDWLLQVEPQAFDILLDQLPWGISMIKLPWMEKMLWVEWR